MLLEEEGMTQKLSAWKLASGLGFQNRVLVPQAPSKEKHVIEMLDYSLQWAWPLSLAQGASCLAKFLSR